MVMISELDQSLHRQYQGLYNPEELFFKIMEIKKLFHLPLTSEW